MLRMSESEETYSLLPIEECAIHPLARIRFDYQVDGLAESIRAMGQVQPGKAVELPSVDSSGAKYLVYVGCRRFIACRKATVKRFKALVVKTIEDSRLQREVLTENVKRTNLTVLEELNMLANYSRNQYSLEDLSKDIGLSANLVRERVKLAIMLQDKGLIKSLYEVESISGFTFTHRHIEKITAAEEAKWLPLAIGAAERNWKAEQIQDFAQRFPVETLLGAIPGWGRQFIQGSDIPPDSNDAGATNGTHLADARSGDIVGRAPSSESNTEHERDKREETERYGSHSRYQTIAAEAQFLICPSCGFESAIEAPRFPAATLLKPGRTDTEANMISLGKESIPLLLSLVSVTCTNDECKMPMLVALDRSGDSLVLAGKDRLLDLIGRGPQPEDGGGGALVWDRTEETWLKSQSSGGVLEPVYHSYDEKLGRWIIPVELGSHTARVAG